MKCMFIKRNIYLHTCFPRAEELIVSLLLSKCSVLQYHFMSDQFCAGEEFLCEVIKTG